MLRKLAFDLQHKFGDGTTAVRRCRMSTTALFAELVVGGILTLTWIGISAMTVVGSPQITRLFGGSSITVGILLALAYALGVVFDRVWDFLLDITGVQQWLRGRSGPVEMQTENDRLRRRLFLADAKAAVDFVDYHRSRMRVARASVFNFGLITVSGMCFLAVRCGGVCTVEFALAGLGGVGLCGASGLALWKLTRSHDRVLRIVSSGDDDAPPATAGPPN